MRTFTMLTLFVGIFLTLSSSLCGCQRGRTPQKSAILDARRAPVVGAIEEAEIAGYCPVAYVEANRPVRGVRRHAVDHEGRTYWFVDAGAKAAYEAHPERYPVAFRGWSVVELARGDLEASDPEIFAVHEGTIYLLSSTTTREQFLADPDTFVELATKSWALKQ